MLGASLLLFVSALSTEWAYQGQEKMHMVLVSVATTTFLQLFLVWTFVKAPDDILKAPLFYSLAAFLIPVLFLFHFKIMIKKIFLANLIQNDHVKTWQHLGDTTLEIERKIVESVENLLLEMRRDIRKAKELG